MKFYKRFPGDITIKTGDLTLTEFGAYDRLLDHYYAKEKPIEAKRAYTVARCQTAEDRRAVDRVLAEFWTLTDEGWVQQRADEMIAEALPKIEAARENGKKGGRPKGTNKKPTGLSEETQQRTEGADSEKASQNKTSSLRSEDSEANASAAGAAAAKTPEELTKAELWAAGKSLLREAGMPEAQCGSFIGKLVSDYKAYPDLLVDAVRAAVVAQPADPASFIVATCQRIAGKRQPSSTRAAERKQTMAALGGEFVRGESHATGDVIDA